mmetsp:Transcript_28503/g.67427  ORF Transcript_28503/g.67427 Transcript_28503/m.67427 type:complete len:200 (-) Transcript_28503:368-967(-)
MCILCIQPLRCLQCRSQFFYRPVCLLECGLQPRVVRAQPLHLAPQSPHLVPQLSRLARRDTCRLPRHGLSLLRLLRLVPGVGQLLLVLLGPQHLQPELVPERHDLLLCVAQLFLALSESAQLLLQLSDQLLVLAQLPLELGYLSVVECVSVSASSVFRRQRRQLRSQPRQLRFQRPVLSLELVSLCDGRRRRRHVATIL